MEHLYGGMFQYLNTEAIWPVSILIFILFLYFSMFKCWSICMKECFNSWIVEYWRCSASDYFDYFYIFQCLSVGAFIWRNVSILEYLNTDDVWPVIILIIWLFWLFLYYSMFKCWSICMEECFNIWIVEWYIRPVIILITSIFSNF